MYTRRQQLPEKKFGVGIGSFFIPGLGQCINGQWGKGIGIFAGTTAFAMTPLIALIGSMKGGSPMKMSVLSMIGSIGTLIMQVVSAVDAVKNAKSETIQIVPKQANNNKINYSV